MQVTYTNQQVVEATGLPSRRVQYFAKQGVLRPIGETAGSFRYPWSEVEIGRLLAELDKHELGSAALLRVSEKFREIINLADTGFLATNAELRNEAQKLIDGDGPALMNRAYGGGAGLPRSNPVKRSLPIGKLDTESQNLFWCYVAYRLAKDKKSQSAWVIWVENEELHIFPRVFQEWSTTGFGQWGLYAEFGNKTKGSGIIVDLRVLT